ncbi:MAG: T9SS type A sorting domain-containing protein [Candidatus Marinimicrobia bacterium]|nr:T9SS type A sorting domain-containing protein [Candidatus Neomarinimicrobiota bacterium]
MKRLSLLFLSVICASFLFAATSPFMYTPPYDMLVLNRYDFPPQEISASIDSQRAVYESWLTIPGAHSKGQTGLFILDLFAMRDTVENAAEHQMQIVFDMMDEIFYTMYYIEQSVYEITDSVYNQYDLIDNMYEYMSEGKDDSLLMMVNDIQIHLEERYYMTLDNINTTMSKLSVIGDTMGTKFDTIVTSGENFIFSVGYVQMLVDSSGMPYYDTSEVAMIYDESFLSVNAAIEDLENAVDKLGAGIDHILTSDSLALFGIDSLIASAQYLQSACDTLNNFSMYSFLDSTMLEDVKGGFAEAEAMLSGKIYSIENVDFRPVGILENLHYGLYHTYIDIYWQTDPYNYSFRNIFPIGLPGTFVDRILPDMVIDPRDTRAEMENYLTALAGQYAVTLYSDPTNIDAHTGLGYIELFGMLRDVTDQGQQIAALVDGGRIDSLFQNYDWTNLDYTGEINSIRGRLDHHYNGMLAGDTTVYTILIKDPARSSRGHSIVEGDFLYPVYIIPQVTNGIVEFTYYAENAIIAMKNGAEYIYTQVDSMIDITLDPNTLDLSNINEPLDLIYALETSNPNFLAFTPEGKVKFAAIGDSIALGMQYMSDMADTVIATMEYAELLMYEFGMTETEYDTMMLEMYMMNNMIHTMATDLAVPDAYTFMGDENVNLSAWFDNVPDNMLTVMKNYYEGTDSSMAGMFPDRMIQGSTDPASLPRSFALKGNYPNPFNPATTIVFDLPKKDIVNASIFDISGRTVASLIQGRLMQPGQYELLWDAGNFPSGVYILRLQYGSSFAFHKMTLLK